MKVLFVIQNMQTGGIATALTNMLKELANNNDLEIDLLVFGDGSALCEVPSTIRIYQGNLLLRLVATPFVEVRKSKKTLEIVLRMLEMLFVRMVGSKGFYRFLFNQQVKLAQYDIAVSYSHDHPTNYFNQGTNLFVDEYVNAKTKIAWIHTDPIKAKFNVDYCKNIYKNFTRLVCVSAECKRNFAALIPEYSHKTHVVYNFIPTEEIRKKALLFKPFEINRMLHIVTVGRIDNATKRIDRAVKICKLLKDDGIRNFKWHIVGDGPDLADNRDMACNLGVDMLLEFTGHQSNPYPYVKNSDLFVLTSAFEGYPMVVAEALALGVPVLAANYAAATEQITNGKNGIIVQNKTSELYRAMKELFLNPQKLKTLAGNPHKKEYTNAKAYNQLMNIICSNVNGAGS